MSYRRQSLMNYAEEYDVSCTSRKYNKSRSYIFSGDSTWMEVKQPVSPDGYPNCHPNQYTQAGLKFICDMRRRNSVLGMIEL